MNKQVWFTAMIMVVVGGGGGYWFAMQQMPVSERDMEMRANQKNTEQAKVLFYRNPMNPAITSPLPAKDNMGMDYIPVYADTASSDAAGTVTINPTIVQNIGVRTTTAILTTLSRSVRTVGRVTFDEKRVTRLHPKYDGWVEKMFIDTTGEKVRKNSMLMSIYAPQLVASQEEYLLALNNAQMLKASPFPDIRDGAKSLLRSARERLELLDMPPHQIQKLKETHKVMKAVHIHSPFDGIVMKIGARDGQRITPDTELYMVADLSRVWVIVDLYEDDLPWVREGDIAEMRVAGIPGRTFTGVVSYIYPYLEAKTRTVKMRLEFDNPELALKPEMFANVMVKAGKQIDAVVVPSEAIVRTGEQDQVFVQRAPGKFEPRRVVVGVDSDGQVQILEGLEAGEIVVTSSQFLIDSESKLKEATAKMMEATQAKPAPAEMDMSGMKFSNDMNMDEMGGDEEPTGGSQVSSHPMPMDSMQMPSGDQHEHGGDHE